MTEQLPGIQLTDDRAGSPADAGGLTFIGTATVLLRLGSFTLLTDPNFLHAGERAYLGGGLSSKRLTDPALELDALPPIDLVVLSHHHGDHFDKVAAEGLDKDLPIVTEPHSAKKLRRQGFRNARALETWQEQVVRRGDEELTITAVPGKHSPRALGIVVPPVMGSMLELRRAGTLLHRTYITGDTLLFEDIRQIPERYPDIDLCLIHLGGTRIAGVLLTMDGAMGVRFLQLVRPRTAVPIHHGDYRVFRSPLTDFTTAASDDALGDTDIVVVERGGTYAFPLRHATDR
jgi:L-ascorbate metabolism protein UlaG (beta-lactamase superfamily)